MMHYIYQHNMYLYTASYNFGWFYGVLRHFQHYFSYIYIVAVSFIGGGNRSTRRKPPTCRKSLANFITYCNISGDRHRLHK